MGTFWNSVGGKLADRWATVSAPALVYWFGGLLAYAYSRHGLHTLATLFGTQFGPNQVAAILTALIVVVASGIVMQRIITPALRILEGYWPSWAAPLRRKLTTRLVDRAAIEDAEWQRLYPQVVGTGASPANDQITAFVRLDVIRRRRPNNYDRFMPTRTGNILRAAESWPADKYGLDAVAVWPRLWLLLPDTARQEILAARGSVDTAVATAMWGLLFCAFTPWTTPLVIPIGLAVAFAAVRWWLPASAEVFGDLLESAYDLYRTALYSQLRWPLPCNPEQERSQGQQLTSYLWRGSEHASPTFTPPAT